jgi:hypothetical protein
MTKTKTLKIVAAFSLAMLLGASLFAASENVVSKTSTSANTAIIDLLVNPTFNTDACCGN